MTEGIANPSTNKHLQDATQRLEQVVRNQINMIRSDPDAPHVYQDLETRAWPTYRARHHQRYEDWVDSLDHYFKARENMTKMMKYGEPIISTADLLTYELGLFNKSLPEQLECIGRLDKNRLTWRDYDNTWFNRSTIYGPRWQREETLGFLFQARGVLSRLGFRFHKKNLNHIEEAWCFEHSDAQGRKFRVDFVGLKNEYFVFDWYVNGVHRPEFTMNFDEKHTKAQGIPLTMTQASFRGFLTPLEAWLYSANWRSCISWLNADLPPRLV